MSRRTALAAALALALTSSLYAAQDPSPSNERVHIPRTPAPIRIDGDISDAGWQSAAKFETWYETRPGDNIEPKVRQVGYVTYDDRFFYVAIDMSDPNPRAISGNYGDHDRISGNSDDFAGIIVDTRGDGKTGYEFFVTARGVQFDAVMDDSVGNEDPSPDFHWDAQTRIHERGWTMEMRLPFSSLRYSGSDPQFRFILYRNYPRDRRYQIFTTKLPRGQNCFVCSFTPTSGMENLPSGGHLVAAPYTTMRQLGQAESSLGSPIRYGDAGGEIGADVKWTPNADTAVDATVNPDFSQIESDVAVISTNERFAIFYPEKRPFFLEGVELFNTPINAVYTRTITSPRWGLRSTGKLGGNAYTLLVAQDRGGGSVIIPSTFGSDFAAQDFSSLAVIGRVRRDFGKSFVSFLGTTREISGGGYNRVFGPDFQIRNEHHALTGQFLVSDTETPNRPLMHEEWNGRKMRGNAAWLYYTYSGKKWDMLVDGRTFSDDFRADNGFVPQVGHRVNFGEIGRSFYPEKSFFSRIRTFAMAEYDSTQEGKQLYRVVSFGAGAEGRYRSFSRVRFADETIRDRESVFQRRQLRYNFSVALGRIVPSVYVDGSIGEDIDFVRARLGRGANVSLGGTLRPTTHLAVDLTNSVRWLNVKNDAGEHDRLFTSQVERLRATYTFNNRMFLRAIVQNQRTNRDVSLYGLPVPQHSGNLASQLLFGYKLNWQTLLYVGGGDLREVDVDGDLEPSSREVFLKVSYAFQR